MEDKKVAGDKRRMSELGAVGKGEKKLCRQHRFIDMILVGVMQRVMRRVIQYHG